MTTRFAAVWMWLALAPVTAHLRSGMEAQAPARPPENVKVLTDTPPDTLRAEMQRMSNALGVECDHCHVQGNFASDEKRPKRVARVMLTMTKALNAQHFPKYQPKPDDSTLGRVTCFTCHQGTTTPKT
ncbi:MAG: c-type cytochrome [Acidobacteria bacterium]|nr:c-type cytochrome [Acidobacteriota bacterium]